MKEIDLSEKLKQLEAEVENEIRIKNEETQKRQSVPVAQKPQTMMLPEPKTRADFMQVGIPNQSSTVPPAQANNVPVQAPRLPQGISVSQNQLPMLQAPKPRIDFMKTSLHNLPQAMAPVAQSKEERIQQAEAIRQVAADNDVTLPKELDMGLDSGAKKAVQAAQQELINAVPSLEAVKNGGNTNENQSISTEVAKAEEGINAEDKIQHAESGQGKEGAVQVNEDNVADNAATEHFTRGTHIHTRTGEENPAAICVIVTLKLCPKELVAKSVICMVSFVKSKSFVYASPGRSIPVLFKSPN